MFLKTPVLELSVCAHKRWYSNRKVARRSSYGSQLLATILAARWKIGSIRLRSSLSSWGWKAMIAAIVVSISQFSSMSNKRLSWNRKSSLLVGNGIRLSSRQMWMASRGGSSERREFSVLFSSVLFLSVFSPSVWRMSFVTLVSVAFASSARCGSVDCESIDCGLKDASIACTLWNISGW